MALTIDLSLRNQKLYAGCEVEEVAGRLNLVTPVADAINIVGRNIHEMIAEVPADQRDNVELTGPMAVWSYIIVFHAVVHVFKIVRYNDGKGSYVVAKHGQACQPRTCPKLDDHEHLEGAAPDRNVAWKQKGLLV